MSDGPFAAAILSPLAEEDLEAIADFIAVDNPERAISFVRELRQTCDKVAGRPTAYRRRPELGVGVRSGIHGRYIILFTTTDRGVTILRILHAARDLPTAFKP